MSAGIASLQPTELPEPTRRDFLTVSASAFAAVGIAGALWPVLDSLNPSGQARAEATTEVNLAPIPPGQIVTVRWQGKPVFIAHRTPEQIAAAEAADPLATIDPARDASRVKRKQWLVVLGTCTHLGCIPTSRGSGGLTPQFGGWVCSCHYSQYDISGRVRRGPAPANLAVPPYTFKGDMLVIG
jgi:ubiquinol-cytochrome c reductase iron-sulfur subunit